MKFNQMINLAIKNIFRSKLKTLTSMLIISTGIITLLLTQGINQGTQKAYQSNFLEKSSLKEIKVVPNIDDNEGLNTNSEKKFSSINHVKETYFPISELTELLDLSSTQIDKLWINSMPSSIAPKPVKGKLYSQKNEILLPKEIGGKDTAKYVGKSLKINHIVSKGGKTSVEASVVKVSGIYDESKLNVSKGTALASPHFVYSLHADTSGLSVEDMLRLEDFQALSLISDNTESVPNIAKEVEDQGYNTEYSLKEVQQMPGLLGMIPLIGTVISLIILLIGAINIGMLTIQNVRNRYSEIGLLKALGFKNHLVIRIFLIETIIVGITSYIIAILIFFITKFVLNYLIVTRLDGQFTVMSDIKTLAGSLVISLLAAIIGSIIPTIKAAKINPSTALKE